MNICHTCNNTCTSCMEIRINGKVYYFDSFQCAIHQLAPNCCHCGCKIIGHPLIQELYQFCCVHCASAHEATPG